MRIALLVSGILSQQYESLTITTTKLAEKLAEKNHEVVIITRKKFAAPTIERKGKITFFRIKSIPHFSVYNKLLSYPLSFRKIQKIIGPFDVIHGFSASPILILRSILSKYLFCRKARIIHTLKSYPIKKDITSKKGSFLLSRIGDTGYGLLNFADMITVPTNTYANKLIAKGVKKEKVKVISSFIDLNKYFPQNKEELKAKYGYNNQKIIFHYGSMWEIKGTNYLLESLPILVQNHPNLLLILAPRNKEQALKKYIPLIQKLKIEKYVKWVLTEIRVEDYVNLADAVALPYPHLEGTEGNPSCFLEALACGTPVVSTNLPELKEVFSECAILIEPKNIKELVKAVNLVLNNNNSEKIEKGLEIVSKFSIDQITPKFLEIYNKS